MMNVSSRASKPVICVRFPAGPPQNPNLFTPMVGLVYRLFLPSWQQKNGGNALSLLPFSPFNTDTGPAPTWLPRLAAYQG
jgi:hypothetical protein